MSSTRTIERAAAAFKKEQQVREGQKAMSEYKAAMAKQEKNIERLRALRLAREADAESAAEAKSPSPATAKPRRAGKTKAGKRPN